ncbi:hypothetical protein WN55_04522 [Dufourea novaeangliae]|uniref:Uncharacterized protein n=1 Tax=Dufourea novaeangliae TaxID=178035 RepID=A0A154P180_DUFNO|nr:hypothetical protein WN55_04522 [Dufourea novaeangliae]
MNEYSPMNCFLKIKIKHYRSMTTRAAKDSANTFRHLNFTVHNVTKTLKSDRVFGDDQKCTMKFDDFDGNNTAISKKNTVRLGCNSFE